MSFAQQLRRETAKESNAAFDAAVDDVRRQWRAAPGTPKGGAESLPRRSGRLRGNLREKNRNKSGLVKSVDFELEALNDGTDYAVVLDKVRTVKISAKKAKALRWFDGGQPVFAKSVEYQNKWFGFWDRWWTEERWDKAVDDGFEKVSRGS